MGQALGSVLPLAVAIAVFPVPVIAIVLVLGSDDGTAKGLAFAVAWLVGLAAVGGAALLVGGAADASHDGETATWVNLLLLGLGLLLVGLAVAEWRSRPGDGEDVVLPAWMRRVDGLTTARAGGAGIALSALNPKNVLLTVAAAAEIAATGLPAGQQAAVLLVFVVVASVGVLAPLVLSLVLGDRSEALLDGLRVWLVRHNAAIVTVLFLLIGAKLIGDAVSGLSG